MPPIFAKYLVDEKQKSLGTDNVESDSELGDEDIASDHELSLGLSQQNACKNPNTFLFSISIFLHYMKMTKVRVNQETGKNKVLHLAKEKL